MIVNFGIAQRYISVTHFTKRPARWQHAVSNISDMSTVQVVIPVSSSTQQGLFKFKVRFFDTTNHERFDIQYHVNNTGLLTFFLPMADSMTQPSFSGFLYITQLKNN